MDQTNINNIPLDLDKKITSYKLLVLFFFLFCLISILLYIFNPKGLNKIFGYEMALTAPLLLILAFLIKEVIIFKDNPSQSFFSGFSQSSQPWFLRAIIIMIILIGLTGFFSMLAIGGVFSDKPPENNTAMVFNFGLILAFLIIALVLYSKSKKKDDTMLQTFPRTVQYLFELRSKYTALFFILLISIIILYLVNPLGIMTDYGGPVLFFSLFVGMILMVLITVYQYYLANPSKGNIFKDEPGFLSYLVKGLYILGALAISAGLIFGALKMMGVFDQDASNPESWGHILFNIVLFCAMLGIIYKLANAGGFLDKNPYYRLLLNTLLYIPCLLVSITNQPIQTDVLTNVASYQTLSGTEKFNYQYAISFWFYLDSFPPSTSASYLKVVPILSYGENPTVKYSSANNTLYITVKQKTNDTPVIDYIQEKETEIKTETVEKWKSVQETIADAIEKVKEMPFGNDIDAEGHRIIYKHPDVLLQKWNHIVLNYNGGTLDVFYNGKLVKSAIEVVPYMKFDMLTVGSNKGISGNLANLIYFKQPLDYLTIHKLYASLKDNNPPSIPENTDTIIKS